MKLFHFWTSSNWWMYVFTLPFLRLTGLNVCMKRTFTAQLASGWWAPRKKKGAQQRCWINPSLSLPALQMLPKPNSGLHTAQPTKELASLLSQSLWVSTEQSTNRPWCRPAMELRNRQDVAKVRGFMRFPPTWEAWLCHPGTGRLLWIVFLMSELHLPSVCSVGLCKGTVKAGYKEWGKQSWIVGSKKDHTGQGIFVLQDYSCAAVCAFLMEFSHIAVNSASVNGYSGNGLETATRGLSKTAVSIQPVKHHSRLKHSICNLSLQIPRTEGSWTFTISWKELLKFWSALPQSKGKKRW